VALLSSLYRNDNAAGPQANVLTTLKEILFFATTFFVTSHWQNYLSQLLTKKIVAKNIFLVVPAQGPKVCEVNVVFGIV
jgi:hypothetical protein